MSQITVKQLEIYLDTDLVLNIGEKIYVVLKIIANKLRNDL